MKLIILAGGTGTRLWPMSRKQKPKQFYELLSSEPMIKDTYSRFLDFFPKEDIYFSTNELFLKKLKALFPQTPETHFIIEPEKRDTGPAMGYASAVLSLDHADEPMAFIPSDHYIANIERFNQTLLAAEMMIKKTDKMVDIAIQPNFPSTVVGYTKIGKRMGECDGIYFYEFVGHKEKPEYELAKKYLEQGDYLWHANYYMWTPNRFLEVFKRYAPRDYRLLLEIKKAHEQKNQQKIKHFYSGLEKISFDYAITEKMDPKDVLIIRGDFGWSDIGAWDVLYDRMSLQSTDERNLIKGQCVSVDTHNTLVYGPKDKIIATLGINDMIIVDTGDALLVCPQGRAQDVKKIVGRLEEQGLDSYL